mgnify:CR=1 FL=1
MIQKAALHGIGEDRTQRCVYALHGMLGERPSSFKADNLSQIRIEVTEVLGAEFRSVFIFICSSNKALGKRR